jgi:Kef-type K+ transport system membrane component KefB
VQLSLVAICLSTAWVCGRAELSEELGAFLAGAMVAAAERSLVVRGALLPSAALTSPLSGDASPRGAAAAAALAAASAALPAGVGGGGGSGHHGGPAMMCSNIESISNVLTALFVASIGLIMSPVFLWHHAAVLLTGTAVLMVIKAAVVAGVVRLLGVPARTAWAAGLTMAHTGEFSFVLLSMAHQLSLLPETVRGRPGARAGGRAGGRADGRVGRQGLPPRRAARWVKGPSAARASETSGPRAHPRLAPLPALPPVPHSQLYMLLLGVTAMSLLTTPMVILLTHKLMDGGSLQYAPVGSGGGGGGGADDGSTPCTGTARHVSAKARPAGGGGGGPGGRPDLRIDVEA